MKNKKIKIFKIILFVILILIMVICTIKLFPMFKNLSTEEGRMTLKDEIQGLGFKGIIVFIGLFFIQMFLMVLPGEPLEILAGMCFGSIGGMIVVLIGAFLSSVIIFFSVKKFGRDFIYSFVPKEKIEKIESSKALSNKKNLNIAFIILFMIPGTPKDLFTYIGGLLPVDSWKFIAIATFCRIPSIISSTIAGKSLIDGEWKISLIVYVITFLITIIGIFILKKFENEE